MRAFACVVGLALASGFTARQSGLSATRTAPRAPLTRRYAREAPDVLNLAKVQIEQFKKTHAGPQPAELKALEASLRAKAGEMEVGAKMYELMCAAYLDYDRDAADPDKLVPSPTAGQALDKDAPGLAEVMTYLYTYGMNMIPAGVIGIEDCTRIVEERLAGRVGLTGQQLDDWLDV